MDYSFDERVPTQDIFQVDSDSDFKQKLIALQSPITKSPPPLWVPSDEGAAHRDFSYMESLNH